jgi:hypothetical protein
LASGLRQDDASQPVQLGLIVVLAGRCGHFGSPIERSERVIKLTRSEMGFCQISKPLGFEQAGTHAVHAGQAGAKLSDTLHVPTKGGQRKASA